MTQGDFSLTSKINLIIGACWCYSSWNPFSTKANTQVTAPAGILSTAASSARLECFRKESVLWGIWLISYGEFTFRWLLLVSWFNFFTLNTKNSWLLLKEPNLDQFKWIKKCTTSEKQTSSHCIHTVPGRVRSHFDLVQCWTALRFLVFLFLF